MNIYWNFALYFLIFQPVVVLSEGPRNVHFSLSQMSLFLNKMDELLESKCIMNESALEEIRRGEVSKWEKELKQFILKLKCSELETLFAQIDIKIDPMEIDDQQQPSTISTFWFDLEYFNVYMSWHEPDENITAWKLDVPMLNEQRFVQSLLNYCKGYNTMEILLKDGFKDFLSTFQKNEKSWAIVMPSAIEKMKREIDEQIKSLNEKFTLSLNTVEQNRLFLLLMYEIALRFVQNLLVNGLLNDEERKKLVHNIKSKMEDIYFKKDLKYFEGIEQYYYGIETGTKLREWLGKFKNEQKNQNQLVSIEQIGSNESILADFVEAKLADSIGVLLREGESLALLDWCHKNHRQISMAELAYIVEKLRELLFPDVPIMEWERERERTLRADFKYENVIASELRMKFPIELEEFGHTIIGQFIYQKCGKHLWNLVDKMDELTNCSNRLDFAEFGRSFSTNRSFMLANLVVNVLKCEELANGADKWSCQYSDHIFEQITNVEIEIKRFILKGLLEFGRLFMETFGIQAMENSYLGDWRTMLWKNISITFAEYNNLVAEKGAIKNSLKKAGMIEAMDDEIVKNRDNQLAKAGVKRKNISRSNQLKKN
uniref:Uncharacterized protein n=1 Tax=Globodera rostochiensis TaxID=31243 RepID=A0A914HM46_GLORO